MKSSAETTNTSRVGVGGGLQTRHRKPPASMFLRPAHVLTVLNAAGLLFGAIFILAGAATKAWNIYGVAVILTLMGNLFLALSSRAPSWAAIGYSAIAMVGMLLVPLQNMVASWTTPDSLSRTAIVTMLFLFASGAALSVAAARKSNGTPPPSRPNSIGRWFISVLLSLFTAAGIFLAYVLLDAPLKVSFLASLIEVFIPEFGVFFGLFFLAAGVLIARLLDTAGGIYRKTVFAVSLVLFVIFMVPLVLTPSMTADADQAVSAAFGDRFLAEPAFQRPPFRQTRFSIPEYFFGTPADGYAVQYNVVYYRGEQGADKGLNLKFDVYRPEKDPETLPGQGSILIRIHGGGWSSGDKGGMNFGEMNKYFARQGYVVFDIQYGLSTKTAMAMKTDRSGDYTIDDMIRHIGIFTTYLADHAKEYGANTESVFISGGSAGGHLTLAVGLGLTHGKHADLLDPRIAVKGLIPFYPANELAAGTEIGGSAEWFDIRGQIDRSAPPTLIYQGTCDSITPPWIARHVQQAYQANGQSKIAIISLPLGTHGSDLYFSSYYNQAFLYYMERFMHQHR